MHLDTKYHRKRLILLPAAFATNGTDGTAGSALRGYWYRWLYGWIGTFLGTVNTVYKKERKCLKVCNNDEITTFSYHSFYLCPIALLPPSDPAVASPHHCQKPPLDTTRLSRLRAVCHSGRHRAYPGAKHWYQYRSTVPTARLCSVVQPVGAGTVGCAIRLHGTGSTLFCPLFLL